MSKLKSKSKLKTCAKSGKNLRTNFSLVPTSRLVNRISRAFPLATTNELVEQLAGWFRYGAMLQLNCRNLPDWAVGERLLLLNQWGKACAYAVSLGYQAQSNHKLI